VSQFRAGRHREIKEMLIGAWDVAYEDRLLRFELQADTIDMVPEGFGSLAYLCLSPNGRSFADREMAEGRVVVFDFGGYSLDVMTYITLNLGPVNDTITTGIINVRSTINKALKSRYNRPDVPTHILDEVIRTRHYKHAGGPPEPVGDVVDAALVNLTKDALKIWQEDLRGGVDYDTVIITGGGGPLIGPLLAPQLGHRHVQIIPEGEAHLANALGALRHRKFKRQYAQ
jgi:hypothetical protein